MKSNAYPVKTGFLGMGLVIDYERLFELEQMVEKHEKVNEEKKEKPYIKRKQNIKLNRKMLKR